MSTTMSRFRPASQQRGEETRARILDAALELFAASGFDGASTRTIAEQAGVNLPAIQYYFGSKEGRSIARWSSSSARKFAPGSRRSPSAYAPSWRAVNPRAGDWSACCATCSTS